MTINIAAEWEQYLLAKVESGKYSSVECAVLDALQRLRESDRDIEQLRHEIMRGIAEADAGLATTIDESALTQIKLQARAVHTSP